MASCPGCNADLPRDAAFCPKCGTPVAAAGSALRGAEAVPAPPGLDRFLDDLRSSLAPRYELLGKLGSGGMCTVFLARELALKRLVAVKVLSPYLAVDPTPRARFENEGRAAAAVSHPNVVSIYGVGETAESGVPYIVMQHVEGGTLDRWARSTGRLKERELRRVVGEVAAALSAAHARGLVHRDVKPGNVLLEAESGRALVTDFGISAVRGVPGEPETTALTVTGMVIGTPMYMSPEQAAGESVGPASDVYSLGVLAYELAVGELPFHATSAMAWAAAHMRDAPPSVAQRRPDLPPEITQLVERCLAKDPTDRPTARDIARALLPSLEAEIPWPPPVLRPLFRSGIALARSATVATLASVALASALAYPPRWTLPTGAWWEAYQGAHEVTGSTLGVVSRPLSPAPSSPTWMWYTLLLGAAAALAVSGAILVVGLCRVTRNARERRRKGWRPDTLMDAAADPDGRTGLLVIGAREFASLSPVRRQAIVHARRYVVGTLLVAGLWAITAPAGWAILVVSGALPLAGAGPTPGPLAWSIIVIPAMLGLALAVAAATREWRLLRPLPRRRPQTGATGSAGSSDNEEAAEWYGANRGVGGPARPGGGMPAAVAGIYLTVPVLALGLGALAEVIAAVWGAAGRLRQLGPSTAELVALLDSVAHDDPVAGARKVWQAYLPAPDTTSAATAGEWLRAFAGVQGTYPELPPYDSPPATVRLGPADSTQGSGFRPTASFRMAAGGVSESTLALAQRLERPVGLGNKVLAEELRAAGQALASSRGAAGGPIWADGYLGSGQVAEFRITFEGGYVPNKVDVSASSLNADLDCYLYEGKQLISRDDGYGGSCSIDWSQKLKGTMTMRVRNTGAGTYYTVVSN